ncbi:hypothetical protein C5167_018174 [Papaver somniferum]|uniref:Uncharacterized protein n=1 Tax=Papaver somniferum TaxID=3469 RepID=A0A4Y7IPW6_PAPSO|nr:hypothetical protein C5167_018174 [Papaver somniferum]
MDGRTKQSEYMKKKRSSNLSVDFVAYIHKIGHAQLFRYQGFFFGGKDYAGKENLRKLHKHQTMSLIFSCNPFLGKLSLQISQYEGGCGATATNFTNFQICWQYYAPPSHFCWYVVNKVRIQQILVMGLASEQYLILFLSISYGVTNTSVSLVYM